MKSSIKCTFYLIESLSGNSLLTDFLKSIDFCEIVFKSWFEDDSIDIAFTFGGDGSILWTHKVLVNQNKVIYIAFNAGHIGFLSFLETSNVGDVIERFGRHFEHPELSSNIYYSCYSKIKSSVKDQHGNLLTEMFAINEFSTTRVTNYSGIYKVYWNDVFITSISADGLIVCSTLGSTAYNASVLGPVLLQNNDNLILSAIAPYGINFRSIVFNDKDIVRLEISEKAYGDQFKLVADSNNEFIIKKGHIVEISVDKAHTIKLASLSPDFEKRWAQKIAKVFGWNQN